MSKVSTWILIGSLGCNAFLGAAVITHFLQSPPPAPPAPGRMLEEMAETLPPDDARIMRQAMTERGVMQGRARHEEQFQQLRQAVAAEPFDVEAFRAAEARLRERQTVVSDVLLDVVPKLSSEGRKRLSEFRPPRGPKPR